MHNKECHVASYFDQIQILCWLYIIIVSLKLESCCKGRNEGPLHTRAKSRDHEIVIAQKTVSKGHPMTLPKSSGCGHKPPSVV
jgi:hypothetical protein